MLVFCHRYNPMHYLSVTDAGQYVFAHAGCRARSEIPGDDGVPPDTPPPDNGVGRSTTKSTPQADPLPGQAPTTSTGEVTTPLHLRPIRHFAYLCANYYRLFVCVAPRVAAGGEFGRIDRLAARAARIEPGQRQRARQAAGMRRQYPLVAPAHSVPSHPYEVSAL